MLVGSTPAWMRDKRHHDLVGKGQVELIADTGDDDLANRLQNVQHARSITAFESSLPLPAVIPRQYHSLGHDRTCAVS
jgi:hypothetical protein